MKGNRICKTGHTFIKQIASSVYHEWFISVNQLYNRNNISLKIPVNQSLFENEINKNTFININEIFLENL